MTDKIILVDENDNEIGVGDKLEVHQKELLHRAFSIFVFDWSTKRMLIQQRAINKYHSGGLWSNACCSHPRKGESMEMSLQERLKDELGYHTNFHIVKPDGVDLLIPNDEEIYYAGWFRYYAKFDGLSENEIDHVFLYSPCHGNFAQLKPDKDEVAAVRWVSIAELNDMIDKNPELFTAWFKSAFGYVYKVLVTQARDMDLFFDNNTFVEL